jgi:hypothetical protein
MQSSLIRDEHINSWAMVRQYYKIFKIDRIF